MVLSKLPRMLGPVVVVLGLVAGAQAGFGPRRPAASYTLRSGDTLSAVAARFGVSVDQLASANGVANVHRVYAGKRLTIPGATGSTATNAPAPAPAVPSTALGKLPEQLRAHPDRLSLVPSFQ